MTPFPTRPFLLLLLASLAATPGGCDWGTVEPDPPVLLDGILEPVDPERPVSGSMAAVTQFGATDVSVVAHGLDPEETYAWHLREGSCDGSGGRIGAAEAYPILEPDQDGDATGDTRFSLRLDAERSYAGEVLESVESAADEAESVACADMEEASVTGG